MAEHTGIEWCDHTFNPWIGCTKVSPACDGCYAEELMDRRYHRVEWGGPRVRTSAANWRQPLAWNRKAKADGVRRKVFCASLADVFDNQVNPDWRTDLWALIAECTALDWLLLTKRPQNIAKMLPSETCEGLNMGRPWPWPHVWLGTTVENQEEADRRIPHLLATPAAKRFLSCEPLLGAVRLPAGRCRECGHMNESDGLACEGCGRQTLADRLDWIIAGGESGPHARPSHPDWLRSLRDQCAAAGVAFFFKQWGEFLPRSQRTTQSLPAAEWGTIEPDGSYFPTVTPWNGHDDDGPGAGAVVWRVGKSRAGRLLDGREWNEVPT